MLNFNYIKTKIKENNAFNLLIMSVIIMILGIIFSSLLNFYKINNYKENLFLDKKKIKKIEYAIKNYVLKNNKFPCPALLNCNTEKCVNENYSFGKEFIDDNTNCIYDNEGVFLSEDDNMLYGTIPILDLSLSNDYIFDSYDNKIVYIIDRRLTEKNNFNEFIKKIENSFNDEIFFLLILSKNNSLGRFKYDNLKSGYFNKNIKNNMPIEDFVIDLEDKTLKYYYLTYKNYKDFNLNNIDDYSINCSKYEYNFLGNSFTFEESKYGEIKFSNEMCQNLISYPSDENNYFYISTYKNGNNILLNNRMAKRCGKNGIWEEDFIFNCLEMFCKKPSDILIDSVWNNFNFQIPNTGIVIDSIGQKYQCFNNFYYKID